MRVAVAAAALCATALTAGLGGDGERASAAPGAPNVVLITTDDQTLASLRVMKRTRAAIGDQGATFDNYVAS
jgi:hypothetical protein